MADPQTMIAPDRHPGGGPDAGTGMGPLFEPRLSTHGRDFLKANIEAMDVPLWLKQDCLRILEKRYGKNQG